MTDGAASLTSSVTVFLNYGDPGPTLNAIRSLLATPGARPDRILVVDNGSSETNVDELRRELGHIERSSILPLARNDGFGAGMNAGARWAFERGAGYVVLLNPDVEFHPKWLDFLLSGWDNKTIRCPVILNPRGEISWCGASLQRISKRLLVRRDWPSQDQTISSEIATGAALLVSADSWDKLGGFDEQFFMYWEDVDLSYRARSLGINVEVCGNALVTHEGGATSAGRGWSSPGMYFYAARNRWIFLRLHFPSRATFMLQVLGLPARLASIAVRARADGMRAGPYLTAYSRGWTEGLTRYWSGGLR